MARAINRRSAEMRDGEARAVFLEGMSLALIEEEEERRRGETVEDGSAWM